MSSQVGTGVFSQEMPSHIGKPFFLSGNAVPHREAVFSAGKCAPESGGRFFRPEMPSRIGRPFFPPGGVVPNRDAVFSLSLRAALHSPAPFDRLGGGLVDSFNELVLSDDNSANVRHFSEKNANYMKFNVLRKEMLKARYHRHRPQTTRGGHIRPPPGVVQGTKPRLMPGRHFHQFQFHLRRIRSPHGIPPL